MKKLILLGLLSVIAFSQSVIIEGTVKVDGTVIIQPQDSTAIPVTSVSKCEAYLVDAGVDPNSYIDTGETYEQVGVSISCWGPNLDILLERNY